MNRAEAVRVFQLIKEVVQLQDDVRRLHAGQQVQVAQQREICGRLKAIEASQTETIARLVREKESQSKAIERLGMLLAGVPTREESQDAGVKPHPFDLHSAAARAAGERTRQLLGIPSDFDPEDLKFALEAQH